jgi:hypothetical protein
MRESTHWLSIGYRGRDSFSGRWLTSGARNPITKSAACEGDDTMNYRNMTLALVCIALAALTGCEPKPKEPKASAIAPMHATA